MRQILFFFFALAVLDGATSARAQVINEPEKVMAPAFEFKSREDVLKEYPAKTALPEPPKKAEVVTKAALPAAEPAKAPEPTSKPAAPEVVVTAPPESTGASYVPEEEDLATIGDVDKLAKRIDGLGQSLKSLNISHIGLDRQLGEIQSELGKIRLTTPSGDTGISAADLDSLRVRVTTIEKAFAALDGRVDGAALPAPRVSEHRGPLCVSIEKGRKVCGGEGESGS